jgi:hypothetical protein
MRRIMAGLLTENQHDMKKTVTQLKDLILALIERGVDQATTDTEFNELALAVFEFQFDENKVYREFCESRKRTPVNVTHWKQIPAVPTAAFKDFALTCFPLKDTVAEFHTSGTTQQKPGRHYLTTLELYDAAIMSSFKAYLLPDAGRVPTYGAPRRGQWLVKPRSDAPLAMFVLTPSPQTAPHSSLSYMMGVVLRKCRPPQSGFFISDDQLAGPKLAAELSDAQESGRPVFLLGTAFAFVHFFDFCMESGRTFRLPAGTRVMETGGFKGKSREMSRPLLYGLFDKFLGIPPLRIVNEYGMTELSTQFYDETMRVLRPSDTKAIPPWARVMIIDPRTGKEAVAGERGLICVFDLANLYSVMAIQTEDIGVRDGEKFVVAGRATAAEVRGCSIAADKMLGKKVHKWISG